MVQMYILKKTNLMETVLRQHLIHHILPFLVRFILSISIIDLAAWWIFGREGHWLVCWISYKQVPQLVLNHLDQTLHNCLLLILRVIQTRSLPIHVSVQVHVDRHCSLFQYRSKEYIFIFRLLSLKFIFAHLFSHIFLNKQKFNNPDHLKPYNSPSRTNLFSNLWSLQQ